MVVTYLTYLWKRCLAGRGCGIASWMVLVLGAVGQETPAPVARTNQGPADLWLTNTAQFPSGIPTNGIRTNGFETLHTEVIASHMRVMWANDGLPGTTEVLLLASEDSPGHWPARDWRTYPMTKRGINWEATPPVDDLDVPVIYFVRVGKGADARVSPLRIFQPRGSGLEEPTRVFWPFIEGFEEQLEGWQMIGGREGAIPLKKGIPAKNGKAALSVALPAGGHSVTVATTRIRGWQVQERNATGLRVWMRTRSGVGRARFALFSNAQAPDQVIAVFPNDTSLNDKWQRIDLPLASFPPLPVVEIDWFTIEMIGDGPVEFLVDDLQLLGSWNLLGN